MVKEKNTNKTVLRVAKLNKRALIGSSNHTLRIAKSENVDHKKSNLNRILIGSNNIKNDVFNYIYANRKDTKAIRKDAVYAEEIVLSASPEFFKNKNLDAWIEHQIEFLKTEYNSNCVSAVLHLDEQTPHIHAFVVPILNEKLTHKDWNNSRGGKLSYTKLQDRYEKHNEKFELTRNKKHCRNNVTRKDIKQHYENVVRLKKYMDFAYNKFSKKFKNVMPKKFLGLIYREKDIESTIKAVANSNYKEVVVLKNENIKLKEDIKTQQWSNLKLDIENDKLVNYYKKNESKIKFYDDALKYNLLSKFKSSLATEKVNKVVADEIKKRKDDELKQEQLKKALQQQQIENDNEVLENNTKPFKIDSVKPQTYKTFKLKM